MNSNRLLTTSALRRLLLAQACAVMLPWAAAQNTNAAKPDAQALAKYDKNKNGKLDPDEIAAMQADEAKAAKTPIEKTEGSSGDVITMSPFTVDASDDKGYSASSSLSGSRLNSKLEDLPGSISVVTKQQLLDTAALDINDIFSYEIGTEGTKQFTDLTNDGRGDYDNVSGNPNTSNRVRGLAAANITVGGFTSAGSLPIDTYNLDGVEISRGSNSTLAGMGEAGGTVNLVPGRANTTRETSNLTMRMDSYEGFRGSIDLNRPIFKNVFAMRLSAVYEEKGFVRKPSEDRINRQQLAFTYKPFRTTTIYGSYESFHEWARRANSLTPRDTITPWRQRGSPTFDPTTGFYTVNGVRSATAVTNVSQLPTGISGIGSSNARILQYIDQGNIWFMMRGAAPTNATVGTNTNVTQFTQSTNVALEGPLYKIKGTTDKSLYDWEEVNMAAPNYEIQRADTFTAGLEQNILSSTRHQLDLQIGWRREDLYRYQRGGIAQLDGVGNTLEIDTNEKLLDGRPNPFFLRPFIGGVNPQIFKRPNFNDQYRWQLAYQLNMTREQNWMKWIGLHKAAVYQEYRLNIAPTNGNGLRYHDTVTNNVNFQPAVATGGALFANNGALFYPLYYYGNTKGGGVEYANTGPSNPTGDYKASFLAATSPSWSLAEPVNIQEVYFALGQQKKKIRTFGASLQSFVFNDRIVTTLGKRKDRQMSEDNLGVPTVAQFLDTDYLYRFGQNKKWRQGDTTSKGIALRPFRNWAGINRVATEGSGLPKFLAQAARGLNLYYNKSDSFLPADVAYNLFLEELPNPSGESEEWGVGFNMFNGKFAVRLTRQESLQSNTRSGIGVVATRALSIDFDGPGQTRPFDLFQSYVDWYAGTATVPGIRPDWTLAQAQENAAKQMGYTLDFINSLTGKTISDTNDATSKGWELELQFNPNRYFTLKLTGNQQEAIDSNVSESIQKFIDLRRPIWEAVRVPSTPRPDGTLLPTAGTVWWTTVVSGDSPSSYFVNNVLNPVNLAITTQGKKKPQTREYRFSGLMKYDLAGVFRDNRILRNMSIGGSYSWASKGAIGYYGAAPDSDGVVRRLDRDRPFFDKPVGTLNLLATYRTKLLSDRINTTFQLNVNNVTESGHLQGVGINPDGQYWQYRIVDPRQFILQVRFDM